MPRGLKEAAMKRVSGLVVVAAAVSAAAVAHPHFKKTVSATLPSGVEASVTYNTTPANEVRAQGAKVGEFVTPRGPALKLSGELKTDKATIAAGEYTIGVIKNGEKDWTLALYPGLLKRGEAPDTAKAIRLDSMFSEDKGTAEHMLVDITPGHGKFEGKAVLTLHFGSLFLAGVLA
jgi:hypothetical protein